MPGFFTTRHEAYPDPVNKDQITFTGQVKSVSFSTMSTFEQCPYAVYLSKVGGIPSVSGDAADRGSKLHKLLEDYVSGIVDEVPWSRFKAHNYHAPIIESFREAHRSKTCEVELQLAFTKQLGKAKWESPKAWLRAMIDVVRFENKGKHADIYDYKTGSNKSAAKHRSQLLLYAMLMFLRYPKLQTLRSTAIYLDQKVENFYTSYNRNDLELYWPRYLARLQAVTEATNFQPNPNGFTCRWCQHKTAHEKLEQIIPACEFAYIG